MQPGADRRPPHHQQATSVAPGPYSEHIQGYAQQLQMLQAEEQAAQQHLAHIQQHAAQVTLKHATLSRNVQILRAEHAKLLHSIKQCQAQADAIAKAYQEACEKHAALKAQLISDGGEDAVHRLWGKARRPLQVQANAAELALQVAQEQLDGEAHQAVSAKAPALHALQHTQQRLAETDAALRSYLQQHQMTCSQPAAATSTASPPAAGQHNNTTQDRYMGMASTRCLPQPAATSQTEQVQERGAGQFSAEAEATRQRPAQHGAGLAEPAVCASRAANTAAVPPDPPADGATEAVPQQPAVRASAAAPASAALTAPTQSAEPDVQVVCPPVISVRRLAASIRAATISHTSRASAIPPPVPAGPAASLEDVVQSLADTAQMFEEVCRGGARAAKEPGESCAITAMLDALHLNSTRAAMLLGQRDVSQCPVAIATAAVLDALSQGSTRAAMLLGQSTAAQPTVSPANPKAATITSSPSRHPKQGHPDRRAPLSPSSRSQHGQADKVPIPPSTTSRPGQGQADKLAMPQHTQEAAGRCPVPDSMDYGDEDSRQPKRSRVIPSPKALGPTTACAVSALNTSRGAHPTTGIAQDCSSPPPQLGVPATEASACPPRPQHVASEQGKATAQRHIEKVPPTTVHNRRPLDGAYPPDATPGNPAAPANLAYARHELAALCWGRDAPAPQAAAAGSDSSLTQEHCLPCVSRYKGVSWTNDLTKWHAEVRVNGIDRHLGFFEDEFEAAQAYDEAVVATLGTFKGTNFLDPDNDLTEH